jgi:hypothetical protein
MNLTTQAYNKEPRISRVFDILSQGFLIMIELLTFMYDLGWVIYELRIVS